MVASGSWDHSAIVYSVEPRTETSSGQLTLRKRITGHTQSVQDVVFLDDSDRLLTSSSDQSIVLWDISAQQQQQSACQIQSFTGHEDCVRSLLLDHSVSPARAFYSVSNDQTVRRWMLDSGNCERVYVGHEHFIFDIAELTIGGLFVTCGENNTVAIWHRDQERPMQMLRLPTVTVWSVLAFDPTLFLAAGSDGILYQFTNRPDWTPDPESQSMFDEMLVKQTKIPFATVAHLKLYEESSLQSIPPKQDGERRLIRSLEDNAVLVYQWDEKWHPIGSVPDYNQTEQENVDQSTGRVLFNDEVRSGCRLFFFSDISSF